MEKLGRFRLIIGLIIAIVGIALIALYFILDLNVLLALLVYAIFSLIIIFVFYFLNKWQIDNDDYIEDQLDEGVTNALKISGVGVVVYNEAYEVTWMSSLFQRRSIDRKNEKLLSWIPEIQDLINGSRDMITVVLEDYKYEVTKKDNAFVLIFKDVTVEYDLKKKYEDDAIVFGMINFDNYDEAAEFEEDISTINTDIKLPVMEYLKKYNVTYKTLKNNRLFLILNEKVFKELMDDRFSIINTIRKESKKLDIPITLSMAFARGSDDFKELDEMVANLLDLAQTRGGDQVVVRKVNEEAKFFGGSSEAREKSSKVRVRVMTNTIRDLIHRSSSVIIVGHQEMDADCAGSAICMSAIAQSLKKETYIVSKTGGVEATTQDVLNKYKNELEANHRFVTINEAINHLNDDTLVIMVDHHSAAQSNGQELLANAKRIIILDHHRRSADLDVNPLLVYIEASASSTCELTCELLPYLHGKVQITPVEANIMYLGMLIDTNRFRVRTGARTFDVAKMLRQYGADPSLVEELNEEPYEMIMKRSELINNTDKYKNNILISSMEEGIYPRSIISQACDAMLQTRGVKAAFVIAHISKDEVAISARSKGGFNVQVIMEKMNGGGHMTAAGLQVKDVDVNKLNEELKEVLDEYLKGEEE